jgi:hypothetical protein
MLTPLNLTDRYQIFVDTFSNLEHDFIKACAKIIQDNELLRLWQEDRFKAEQLLNQELGKVINKNVDSKLIKELSKQIDIIANRTIYDDESIYIKAWNNGLSKTLAPPLFQSETRDVITAAFKSIKNVFNKTVFTAKSETIKELRKHVTKVGAGTESITKGIRQAIKEFASDGIIGIRYKESNLTMGIVPYVRRELVTQTMNMTREVSFVRANEWGSDLIQVSSHAGARPLCFPYQGLVLSTNTKDSKYKALKDTSYGKPAGLFGINCRHFFWPFFPGLNKEYTEAERDPAKTDLRVSNEEVYNITQQQRALERKIRAAKKRARELENSGVDKKTANVRVKAYQKQMRDFIDYHQYLNLKRDYLREKSV